MTDDPRRPANPGDPPPGETFVETQIVVDPETGRRWMRCDCCGVVFPIDGDGEDPPERGGSATGASP